MWTSTIWNVKKCKICVNMDKFAAVSRCSVKKSERYEAFMWNIWTLWALWRKCEIWENMDKFAVSQWKHVKYVIIEMIIYENMGNMVKHVMLNYQKIMWTMWNNVKTFHPNNVKYNWIQLLCEICVKKMWNMWKYWIMCSRSLKKSERLPTGQNMNYVKKYELCENMRSGMWAL